MLPRGRRTTMSKVDPRGGCSTSNSFFDTRHEFGREVLKENVAEGFFQNLAQKSA